MSPGFLWPPGLDTHWLWKKNEVSLSAMATVPTAMGRGYCSVGRWCRWLLTEGQAALQNINFSLKFLMFRDIVSWRGLHIPPKKRILREVILPLGFLVFFFRQVLWPGWSYAFELTLKNPPDPARTGQRGATETIKRGEGQSGFKEVDSGDSLREMFFLEDMFPPKGSTCSLKWIASVFCMSFFEDMDMELKVFCNCHTCWAWKESTIPIRLSMNAVLMQSLSQIWGFQASCQTINELLVWRMDHHPSSRASNRTKLSLGTHIFLRNW